MNQTFTTIPAHFDGEEIKLDVALKLKPNTRLLVTILDETVEAEALDRSLTTTAMRASQKAFDRIWDNTEDSVYDDL